MFTNGEDKEIRRVAFAGNFSCCTSSLENFLGVFMLFWILLCHGQSGPGRTARIGLGQLGLADLRMRIRTAC